MMEKNESLLLEPWLIYYGNLFGYENLSVFDNGSTIPLVHAILSKYEALGVFVDRSHDKPVHFAKKGEIIGERMRFLRDSQAYNFLFPIDCDELIVKFTDCGVSCSPEIIIRYLQNLPITPRTYRLNYQVLNIPGQPGYFYVWGGAKTFYNSDSFGWTDRGFHLDGSRNTAGFLDTEIVYLHFHNKPFVDLTTSAVEKLQQFINVTDKELLKDLIDRQGPGSHLAPYLLMDAEQYHGSFSSKTLLYFPAVLDLFKSLGMLEGFLFEKNQLVQPFDSEYPALTLDNIIDDIAVVYDKKSRTRGRFSGKDYFEANPDLVSSGMLPVAHYLMFGAREGRRLRI